MSELLTLYTKTCNILWRLQSSNSKELYKNNKDNFRPQTLTFELKQKLVAIFDGTSEDFALDTVHDKLRDFVHLYSTFLVDKG